MSIFQYEVFLAVVETGSFTKAGESTGLSQSGVSHVISALESELDMVLLHRNRNGISLTNAGERIMPYFRNIVQNGKLIYEEISLLKGLEVGKIKIGSFPSVSTHLLPHLIKQFQLEYPNIEIELHEGGYLDINNWIISGRIDIGFVDLPQKEIETIPLFKDPLTVVLPADHPLSGREVLRVADLENESFIMPKAGCEHLVKTLFKENLVHPSIKFEIADNYTILSLIQENLGISVLPELSLPKNLSGLKCIPFDFEIYRDIGFGLKSTKSASPSVNKFISHTKSHFINNPLI